MLRKGRGLQALGSKHRMGQDQAEKRQKQVVWPAEVQTGGTRQGTVGTMGRWQGFSALANLK